MRLIHLIYPLFAIALASPGTAEEKSRWRVGGGFQAERHSRISGNIGSFNFDSKIINPGFPATISAQYQPSENFHIGADISLPTRLGIEGSHRGKLVEFKTSRVTVMGRYYPRRGKKLHPFLGLGAVYNIYTSETLHGLPTKAMPDIANNWSPALAAGLEITLPKRKAIITELSYSRSSSDILVDGRPVGEISMKPVRLNLSYMSRF